MKDLINKYLDEPSIDLSLKIREAEREKLSVKKELDEMFDNAFGNRKIKVIIGNEKKISLINNKDSI